MHQVPRHLAGEGSIERSVMVGVIVASLAACVTYLGWRVVATLDGAWLPLALVLLALDAWFAVRHVLAVLPALVLPVGGDVPRADTGDQSEAVVPVDIVVVVRDEPLSVLKVTLRSCLEVRGRSGVAAVNNADRPEVHQLCRRLGITVVDPTIAPQLGVEPGRTARALILVPGSAWVSPDVAVMAAGAITSEDVGATRLSNTTHGLVWLVGTRGYEPPIFDDDRLAARLDSAGVGGIANGPVVFDKRALWSIGGVRWEACDPILASWQRVTAAGWRTRSLAAPGAYRMAPASENAALRQRGERFVDWGDALRHAADVEPAGRVSARRQFWERYVVLAAQVERFAVLGRLVALTLPAAALVTGRLPARFGPVSLVGFGGAWALLGMVARRRALGRRQAVAEPLRVGFRSIGADLAVLVDSRTLLRRHPTIQNIVMGALVAAAGASVWLTVGGRFERHGAFEKFVMLAALAVVPALVRDATVAYRQQRLLPRVSYASRGRGDALELSPEGLGVHGALPLGSTQRVDLALPLVGGRVVRRTVPGTVLAHRRTPTSTDSYVKLYADDDLAVELAYFCGVTAPTMRWYGIEPRAVRPLDMPIDPAPGAAGFGGLPVGLVPSGQEAP